VKSKIPMASQRAIIKTLRVARLSAAPRRKRVSEVENRTSGRNEPDLFLIGFLTAGTPGTALGTCAFAQPLGQDIEIETTGENRGRQEDRS
jgi:hypothetical protein